ncbi:MAG TPA: GntR family transcriptional regulator [Sphingomicrobium sp.]
MSPVSRRSSLAGGAALGLIPRGVPAFGSAAARPRVETSPDRLRLHFAGRVTEAHISVAGVASVVSCPPERLANGGGFFADPGGPAPEARSEDLGGRVRLISSGIIVEADKRTGHGTEPEFVPTGDRYGSTASYVAKGHQTTGPIAENALTLMESPRNKRRYEVVAEHLAERIASGHYSIGDRLPSERELAHAGDRR